MAISFGTDGTANVSVAATSSTLATPSGIAVGDLKIAFLTTYGCGTVSQTGGTGTWTKILESADGGSPLVATSAFYKVHASSDTDPTFGWASAGYSYGYIARVTGASTTTPIGAIGTGSHADVNPHTSTAITTTGANSRVIYCDGAIGQTTLTAPSGWTSHFNNVDPTLNTIILTTMYKDVATSGSSSGSTSSDGQNGTWVTFQFEILAFVPSILKPSLKVYLRR